MGILYCCRASLSANNMLLCLPFWHFNFEPQHLTFDPDRWGESHWWFHRTLLGNLGSWHSCEWPLEKPHLPEHSYRPSAPPHGNSSPQCQRHPEQNHVPCPTAKIAQEWHDIFDKKQNASSLTAEEKGGDSSATALSSLSREPSCLNICWTPAWYWWCAHEKDVLFCPLLPPAVLLSISCSIKQNNKETIITALVSLAPDMIM